MGSIGFGGGLLIGFFGMMIILFLVGVFNIGLKINQWQNNRVAKGNYPYLVYTNKLGLSSGNEYNRINEIHEKHLAILKSDISQDLKDEVNNLLNVRLVGLLKDFLPILELKQNTLTPDIVVAGNRNTETYDEIFNNKITEIIKYLNLVIPVFVNIVVTQFNIKRLKPQWH